MSTPYFYVKSQVINQSLCFFGIFFGTMLARKAKRCLVIQKNPPKISLVHVLPGFLKGCSDLCCPSSPLPPIGNYAQILPNSFGHFWTSSLGLYRENYGFRMTASPLLEFPQIFPMFNSNQPHKKSCHKTVLTASTTDTMLW